MRLVLITFVGIVIAVLSPVVAAQAYPAKTIRVIVPFAPGGAGDLMTRLIAVKLASALGQPVIVDNRGGAGGTIGLDAGAKAAPDGYTLVLSPVSALAIAPSLYSRLPYDSIRDFAPIATLAQGPNMLVVHPSVPARSVQELIALARARPGRLTFASSGSTSLSGLAGSLFASMGRVDLVQVPYKGTALGLTEVIGGQVDLMLADLAIALPHVREKRLRALASTGSSRSVLVPQLPTIAEAGVPGYAIVNWRGLLAPAATSREIVMRLHGEVVKALGSPDLRETLAREGYEPMGDTPERFAVLIRSEIARYAKLVKAAGIQVE